MRRCGPWLRHLVSTLATIGCPEGSVGDQRRIVAVDATAICGPGDQQDYHLLHTVYDVTAQCFRSTELTDRHTAERLDVGAIERGEIRLGDRAYGRWRGRWRDLRAVVDAGADYIVRLSANALKLRTPAGGAIKRSVLCRQAEAEGVLDVPLSVHASEGKEQMVARLIVLPLPEGKATAARWLMRKKARKSGYTASPEALATAGCLMLITSLPREAFPAQRILALYQRRWQVELAFKRLKSLIGLEDIRLHDSELIGAWIHAILLVALLIDNERPSLHREGPDSPHWAPHVVSRSRSGASSLCDTSL
jgi:IS4 transposase